MPKQNSPMNMICTLAFVTAAAGMCSANNANAQYGPPDAPAPMTYSERAGHNAPGWDNTIRNRSAHFTRANTLRRWWTHAGGWSREPLVPTLDGSTDL